MEPPKAIFFLPKRLSAPLHTGFGPYAQEASPVRTRGVALARPSQCPPEEENFLKTKFATPLKLHYLCKTIEQTMEKESQTIFDHNVVEFVTVAAEFCKFLEQAEGTRRAAFVDTALKMLPLLYLKATLLPPCEPMGEEEPEHCVTEDTYEVMRLTLASILAERDDYLDVFVEDMKYSDQPITRYISEDLADIYQDVKDFIFVFSLGLNQTMHDALAICQENFRLYWGQKLVNTLRALHEVRYTQSEDEDNEEGTEPDDDFYDEPQDPSRH